jgi:rhodanese-related sulfurtransferase
MSTRVISPQEAQQVLNSGRDHVALDVRTPVEFGASHVPGFRNLPVTELEKAEFAECCKPVVLMCRSGKRAEMAAQKLAGIPGELLIINGGIEGWQSAGLPVEQSHAAPMSLERQVQVTIGTILLLATAAGVLVHPYAFYVAGFIGAGLLFAGLTGTCALGMLIARMPWNRGTNCGASCHVKQSSTTH